MKLEKHRMPEADWGLLQWLEGERNRKITESEPGTSSKLNKRRASYDAAEVSSLLDRKKLLPATETRKSGVAPKR